MRPGSSVSARIGGHVSREETSEASERCFEAECGAESGAKLQIGAVASYGFNEQQFQQDLEQAMEMCRASSSSRPSSKCGSEKPVEAAPAALKRPRRPRRPRTTAPEEAAEEALEEAAEEAPATKPADMVELGPTSTSHRREYMQLSRKMENIDAGKFPEVWALWSSGSKKEPWVGPRVRVRSA